LDRRCTTPAWEQRAVYVQATETRHLQNGFWQDEAIGDNHHDIGLQIGNELLIFLWTKRHWLKYRNPFLLSQHFDRARHQFFAASGRTIRLSEYANDLMLRREQRVEVTRCKIRCAGKYNA
jgi:hypothetical protein